MRGGPRNEEHDPSVLADAQGALERRDGSIEISSVEVDVTHAYACLDKAIAACDGFSQPHTFFSICEGRRECSLLTQTSGQPGSGNHRCEVGPGPGLAREVIREGRDVPAHQLNRAT